MEKGHEKKACNDISREIFGQRIREARKKTGYSLTEAEEIMETSYSHICRIEKGEVIPSVMLAAKLARLYMVSLDYLAGINETGGQ